MNELFYLIRLARFAIMVEEPGSFPCPEMLEATIRLIVVASYFLLLMLGTHRPKKVGSAGIGRLLARVYRCVQPFTQQKAVSRLTSMLESHRRSAVSANHCVLAGE